MLRKWLTILLALATTNAAPATYDQRQDGDVNVKVDLDNFIILVARPVSAFDVLGSMSQLFADSKNSNAATSAIVGLERHKKEELEKDQQIEDSIKNEKKSDDEAIVDELVDTLEAAEKPALVVVNDEKPVLVVVNDKPVDDKDDKDKEARNLKPGKEIKETVKHKPINIGKYKFVESVEEPQSLKLIGDAIENCGPGRSRDRSGICQEDIAQ